MDDSRKKAGSFLKGATILAVAGILSRLLGLFYKVPLYALVGSYGNGIYGNVYSIYNMLLMISTVGLPVGISKMVSESMAQKDYRGTKKIFNVSALFLCSIGCAASLVLFFGAKEIIALSHWPEESYYAMMAIAAAPFINSICSSFRGYFQGFQIMKPTAISQIIEQVIRVGLGIVLAWAAIRYGYGVGMAVGGAVLGATIGGVFAAILLLILYINFLHANRRRFLRGTGTKKTNGQILKRLLWISIPITLTSTLSSLYNLADSMYYVPQLAKAGLDSVTATSMFGDYINVDTLIAIPLVISGNISVAVIPSISESFALRDHKMIGEKIDIAVRVCFLVALPCCVGLSVLSQGIFDLLFPGSVYGPGMLKVFAFVVLLTMISGIFQSVLQAIDKMMIPMINLLIGSVIHIVSCFLLLSVPAVNIYGLGIANLLTFLFLTISNYSFIKKFTHIRINWLKTIILPLISAVVMGVVTKLVYSAVYALLGNVVALCLSVLISVGIYAFMLVFTGGIGETELDMLPGRKFIEPVYQVIKGWRDTLSKEVRRKK